MKTDLRRQVIAKYYAELERLASYLLPGKPKEEQVWRRLFRGQAGKRVMKGLDEYLRKLPDDSFDETMAEMGTMVDKTRMAFKSGVDHLPKKRGGRPPAFPIDTRRRAIEDIGHEYPRCSSFREAVELVATRYGMTPEYLRKVWKNRKRLQEDRGKKS